MGKTWENIKNEGKKVKKEIKDDYVRIKDDLRKVQRIENGMRKNQLMDDWDTD